MRDHDAAIDALDARLDHGSAIAKIALQGQPQMLEALQFGAVA
jgi:hypothetical protein